MTTKILPFYILKLNIQSIYLLARANQMTLQDIKTRPPLFLKTEIELLVSTS